MFAIDPGTARMVSLVVFGFWFGAATGSFIGVVFSRVPEGRSLGGRSRCACGRQLTAWENIPVLSWLVLRGRARCCGTRIPAWLWVCEITVGACAAVGAAVWGVPGVLATSAVGVGAAVLAARCRRRVL